MYSRTTAEEEQKLGREMGIVARFGDVDLDVGLAPRDLLEAKLELTSTSAIFDISLSGHQHYWP